jgi:DNA-binding MarR family transcriptional regulator
MLAPVSTHGWLTEEEQRAWRTLIYLMNRLPAALDSQLQRDARLTHFDYMILVLLSEAPDRSMQLARLAEEASASLSRLSHVVTKLENAGWVRRERNEGVRGARAVLTDAGFATIEAAAPGHVDLVRRIVFRAISPTQVRQLEKIGARILHQINAEARF